MKTLTRWLQAFVSDEIELDDARPVDEVPEPRRAPDEAVAATDQPDRSDRLG